MVTVNSGLELEPKSFSGEILVLLLKYRFKYSIQVNRQAVTKPQKDENMHMDCEDKRLYSANCPSARYILISVDTFSWRIIFTFIIVTNTEEAPGGTPLYGRHTQTLTLIEHGFVSECKSITDDQRSIMSASRRPAFRHFTRNVFQITGTGNAPQRTRRRRRHA